MSFPSSPEQGAVATGGIDPAAVTGARLPALGRRLRQAREAMGLPATVLADRLRLGVEQLEALESADRQRLPEPVFVVAQARRIAEALGLDLSEELQALRASGELEPRPWPGALRPPSPAPTVPTQPCGAGNGGPGAGSLAAGISGLRRRAAAGPNLLLVSTLMLLLAALWGGWRLVGADRMPRGAPRLPQSALPFGRLAEGIPLRGSPRASRLVCPDQGRRVGPLRPGPLASRLG